MSSPFDLMQKCAYKEYRCKGKIKGASPKPPISFFKYKPSLPNEDIS